MNDSKGILMGENLFCEVKEVYCASTNDVVITGEMLILWSSLL